MADDVIIIDDYEDSSKLLDIFQIKPLKCNFCGYRTNHKGHLVRHFKNVHFGGKTFACPEPECEFKTTWRMNIQRHVQAIHEGEIFPCQLCDYKTTDKGYLKKHMQTTHDDKKEKCPECDHMAKKIYMSKHIKRVHEGEGQIFSCTQCEHTYKKKDSLNLHIKRVHEGQIIESKCQYCEFKTKSQGNLWKHKKSVHEGVIFQFKCKQCDFTTKTHKTLKRHKRDIHEDLTKHEEVLIPKTFYCEKCEKIFAQKANLTRHLEAVHLKLTYKCEQCDKKFTQEDNLKTHVRSKHDSVQKTDSKITYKLELTDHETKQIDAGQSNCKQFSFPLAKGLKKHGRTVHKKEAFPCEWCGKEFTQKDNMKRHIKTVNKLYE